MVKDEELPAERSDQMDSLRVYASRMRHQRSDQQNIPSLLSG